MKRICLRNILAIVNLLLIIAAIPSPIGLLVVIVLLDCHRAYATIQQELGRRLSKYASIYFPGSHGCINDTKKWAANTKSNFSVIVVPAIDQDVAATVY